MVRRVFIGQVRVTDRRVKMELRLNRDGVLYAIIVVSGGRRVVRAVEDALRELGVYYRVGEDRYGKTRFRVALSGPVDAFWLRKVIYEKVTGRREPVLATA